MQPVRAFGAVVLVVFGASGSTDDLTGLAGWVSDVMVALGAPGVGALVALETIFPPIPSEVVLPLAGFLAGDGRMSLTAVMVASVVGSLVAALALYFLGALLGRERLYDLVDRAPILRLDDLERADAWFVRHGGKIVFFGRFIPVVRSLVSIPAGITRMSLPRFVLLTTLGSGAWNVLFISAGFALGSSWEDAGQHSDVINYVLYGLIALAIVVLVWKRVRPRPT